MSIHAVSPWLIAGAGPRPGRRRRLACWRWRRRQARPAQGSASILEVLTCLSPFVCRPRRMRPARRPRVREACWRILSRAGGQPCRRRSRLGERSRSGDAWRPSVTERATPDVSRARPAVAGRRRRPSRRCRCHGARVLTSRTDGDSDVPACSSAAAHPAPTPGRRARGPARSAQPDERPPPCAACSASAPTRMPAARPGSTGPQACRRRGFCGQSRANGSPRTPPVAGTGGQRATGVPNGPGGDVRKHARKRTMRKISR